MLKNSWKNGFRSISFRPDPHPPPPPRQVYLLVNLFSKLYVTFILQPIAFLIGKDEEDDH